MKMIAIVLFVLAGLMVLITAAGIAKDVLNPGEGVRVTLAGVLRVAQMRIMYYTTLAITWTGLGVCCLGLDNLLKRKGSAVRAAQPASGAEASAERPRPSQSAVAKPAAEATRKPVARAASPPAASPASEAQAAKPAGAAKPAPGVRPAIRPATDPREE